MIVLEECPRCGEVASHVEDDVLEVREAVRDRLRESGVRLAYPWHHLCPHREFEFPVRRPWWYRALRGR